MGQLKIACMSLYELMGDDDTLGVDLMEWERVAEEIWSAPPFGETMPPGKRLLEYGARLNREYARVCFAQFDGKLVGYAWGYPVTKEELQEISHNTVELDAYFVREGQMGFYISTVGVLPAFRGRKIGPSLFDHFMKEVIPFGFPFIIFRTEIDTVREKMARPWKFEKTGIFDREYTERDYYVLAP